MATQTVKLDDGVRAVEWRKYYPNVGTTTAPTTTAPTTTAPTTTQGRQNLTFADMLKDLGLTGKEQANPEALKKVNDWLAARPGYKAGEKTNAYLKSLQNMPAEQKKETGSEVPKNQQSRPSATGKGYAFKNKSLYRDARRAYKAGASTFSDAAEKNVLNPNVISTLTSRF